MYIDLIKDYEHEILLELLHKYLSIGGMPEALNIFIEKENKNFKFLGVLTPIPAEYVSLEN